MLSRVLLVMMEAHTRESITAVLAGQSVCRWHRKKVVHKDVYHTRWFGVYSRDHNYFDRNVAQHPALSNASWPPSNQ